LQHKSNLSLIRDISVFVAIAGLVCFFVYSLWEVFFPFAIAIIISYLLNPLIGKISLKLNQSRINSVLLIYFIFFSLLGIGLSIVIPLAIKEIATIQLHFPSYVKYVQEYTDSLIITLKTKYPALPIKAINIMDYVKTTGGSFALLSVKSMPAIIHTVTSFAMNLILIPFVTFFLLKDGPFLKSKLYELIPNSYYEIYRNLAYRMDKQLGNYIRGQAMDALICGILSSIGLWIIGVKYFLLIGMLAGIANLIPYFGPVMGMVPAMLVSIMDKGFDSQHLIVIVVMFVCVQLIDNLLVNPVVVGKSVSLHPLVVMIAIMIGGAVGGLFAMLLIVPFVSVMRIVLIEIYSEFKYRKYLALSKNV